jgi:NADPH:quinone reductase-like Zn-dependent oxidoreductase
MVTAVCSSNNVELIRSLGADRGIDYSREDITKSEDKYDLILGVNGNQPLSTYQRMLTPKGIFVVVGGSLEQVLKTLILGPFLSTGSKKMRCLAARHSTQDLDFVIKLVETGRIKPILDRTYPLRQTADAMEYLSQGHARGKVLIAIESQTSYCANKVSYATQPARK